MTAAREQTVEELMASLEGRIARLQKYLPNEKSPPALKIVLPFLSKCPLCQGEMEAGSVTLRDTYSTQWWLWLLLGFPGMSFQDCSFQPAIEGPEQVVVKSRSFRKACRCTSCGFVGIKQEMSNRS